MVVERDEFANRSLLHAFVGRERELAELRAGLDDALGGRGRIFLIVGEPGIGKTRLAEEIAAAGADRGAAVLWGRCWEGRGAPAYWPWVQIFRQLAGEFDAAAVRAAVGDAGGVLAALAPELAERAGSSPSSARALSFASEHERFPLFDAAAGALRQLAAARPLVLVLDDLHGADESSLLLLEFLARELRGAHILVVGTYRDVIVAHREERSRLLAAAARAGHRLSLGGLSAEEVEHLARVALRSADDRHLRDVAGRVYQATEGNPFFVDEILQLLLADPTRVSELEMRIPHGIRDALRERLQPLSPLCHEVLAVASIFGREFDLQRLQSVAGTGTESLLDALGEAEASGVVARPVNAVGRFSFSHAIIRDALYDEVAPARRAKLHWRVAETLAAQSGDAAEPLAELAHHYLRGAAVGDPEKAIDYARRAGERAESLLAYEEAAACFQSALEALGLLGQRDDGRRIELQLALGTAQARAWNTASAQETFAAAGKLAQELYATDPERAAPLVARAALGFGGTGLGVPRGQVADERLLALLEAALRFLGEGHEALRARLLARLAVELYFTNAAERRAALCAEANELARRAADDSTLAYVVSAQHFALWDSPDVDRRLALANEAVALAQRTRELDVEAVARLWRILDLLEKGEVSRWEAEIDELESVARALRQPRELAFAAALRAMRALWRCRFDDVEAFGQQGLAIAQRAQDRGALINLNIQRFALLRARGDHEDALSMLELWWHAMPDHPTLRCMRALLYADLERLEESRRDFERLATDDFGELRRLNSLPTLVPWLSEVCARLDDSARAEALFAALRPHLGHNIMGGPRILFGPVERWAGMLAAVLGRLDEAAALLESAGQRSRAMEGSAAAAWADFELAGVLARRNAADDLERARALLADIAPASESLGLKDLARRARARLEEIREFSERAALRARGGSPTAVDGGAAASRAAPSGRVLLFPHKGGERARLLAEVPRAAAGETYVLRREGEFWTASDGEAVLRLRDSKGLHYLATLLRSPDREFHVLDLVAPERDRGSSHADSLGGAGERQLRNLGMHTAGDAETGEKLLDAQARAAYQRRLEDLREELDEATRFNDPERAARARHEMDFLAAELARAIGLGGRGRSTASGAERARLNVTRAIKAVIRRISRGNPNLGRYLETTVRTGAFCSYRPDPRIKVTWKL